ncbi:MAG: DUF418 domain-containing protein, partial [Anaerolineaceae bacterium]|nr:DUF418 domain-containing protein [Anaerolineaceae bacterium]
MPRVKSLRVTEIDLVRGMALGGMLLVNLSVFTGINRIPLYRLSGLDWLSSFILLFLVEGKFYPLFAFLFGWGIARRQINALEEGAFFISNLRRMLVLSLFGLAHAFLLWQGDILFVYALIGIFLPWMRRISLRLVIPIVVFSLILGSILSLPELGRKWNEGYMALVSPLTAPFHLSQSQSLQNLTFTQQRIREFALKLVFFPNWLGNFFAMILSGYIVGSGRLCLKKVPLRLLIYPSLIINLFYALINAFPNLAPVEWASFLRSITLSLGGPLLAISYALLFAHWQKSQPGKIFFTLLINAGRMPLTLYLLQSLAGAALFFYQVPFAPYLIWPLTGSIFLAQLLFAKLW